MIKASIRISGLSMRSFFFVVFLRRRHFWCGQWRRPKTGDRGNRTPGLNYAKVALYHWAISPFSLLLISLSWPFQYWWLPFIIHAEMKFTHRPYPKLFEIRRRHSRSPMSPLSPHPFPPLLVFRLINNLANVCAKTTTTTTKKKKNKHELLATHPSPIFLLKRWLDAP